MFKAEVLALQNIEQEAPMLCAEPAPKTACGILAEIEELLSKFSPTEESLAEIKRLPLEKQRNILKLMYDEECRRAIAKRAKTNPPLS